MKKLIGLLLLFHLVLYAGYADASSIEPVDNPFYKEMVNITKYEFNCDNVLLKFGDLEVICLYYKDGHVRRIVCTQAQVQRIKNQLKTFIKIRRDYVRQYE